MTHPHHPRTPAISESDKVKECLTEIMTWIREPYWTEETSLEWLMDWINRRPIASIRALTATPRSEQKDGLIMSEQQEPIAMLGGIHGVALIRHIRAMRPAAQSEYHTPLYRTVAQAPDHTQVEAIIRDWLGDYVSHLPPTDGVSKKIVSALGVAQAVPEGFALVPLKPTPAMIEAGCENNPTQWNDGTDDGFTSDVANNVYVAMVRVGSLVSSTVRKAPKSCPHCIDKTDCASVDICNTVADSSGSNPGAIGASKEAGGIAGFATVASASNPSSTNCKCPTPDFCRKQGACEAEECLAPVVTSPNQGGGK